MGKKEVRANFREAVFKRDKGCCKCCKKSCTPIERDAHHITDRTEMPNGGYVLENGITLCNDCHFKAEWFHITEGKDWHEGMHPDDLYKLIGSSKELAIEKSELL